MSKPQPGRLDHRGPQAGIAGFRDPLFLFHIAASPGTWSQPGIRCQLATIGKAAIEALMPKHRGKFRSDTTKLQKLSARRSLWRVLGLKQRIAFGFYLSDLPA